MYTSITENTIARGAKMPPMQWGLALALVTALAVQDPMAAPAKQLTLELRVFTRGRGSDGPDPGDRAPRRRPRRTVAAGSALGRTDRAPGPRRHLRRAGHPRTRRPRPQYSLGQSAGRHALSRRAGPSPRSHQLQERIRRASDSRCQRGGPPDVALYEQGKRDKPATGPFSASGYLLFVVRAGSYDLLARVTGKSDMARRRGRAARSDAAVGHALIASTDAAPCAERAGRRAEAPAVPPVPTRQRSPRPRP